MIERFELTDADGNAHQYIVEPLPVMKGLRISKRIVGALARGVLPALASNFEALYTSATSGIGDAEFTGKLSDMLKDMDVRGAAADIGAVIEDFPEDLILRCFERVIRDDVSLKNTHAMEQAYNANYGELYQALIKIIAVNKFVPFGSKSGASSLAQKVVETSNET